MNQGRDRLYNLLPAIYRLRDADHNHELQTLLQVITEQVNVVEADIGQLYDNWFIETCQDWVVPYIGDLVGYRPVDEAGRFGDITTPQGQQLNQILVSRSQVANVVRYRRRRGTLALLELLAHDVAGWSARAVEFYTLLKLTQSLNHLRSAHGGTVDLRDSEQLDRLDGAFDSLSHSVDVRRISSRHARGYHHSAHVGLFVWRLKAYPITFTQAYCLEEAGSHAYTFSILGNDYPLYTRPELEPDPTHIANDLNVPMPISRHRLEERHPMSGRSHASADYYGIGKSLAIWVRDWAGYDPDLPIPREAIIPADLTRWHYRPPLNHIAVDPQLGRMAFPVDQLPSKEVRVSFHYGFSADMGGGEYQRPLSQPAEVWTFTPADFRNLERFTIKLKTGTAEPIALSNYLKAQFSASTRQWLDAYPGSGEPSDALRDALLVELNRLIQGNSLYDPDRFVGIQLSPATQQLIAQVPDGRDRIRLNRRLLEEAYPRQIARSFALYQVGEGDRLNQILRQWRRERPRQAVIELTSSRVVVEQINIQLRAGQSLQLRGANGARPTLRLLDWHTDLPDSLHITGESGSRFTLDGLLITGRGVQVTGSLAELTMRHCTLVPGWILRGNCEPLRPAEPSLEIANTCVNVGTRVTIAHSILGSIQVNQDEVRTDPMPIYISDSILDATSPEREALGAPGCAIAHAVLTIVRTTVIGEIYVHAIALAENSIFNGVLKVARRQQGCMRFCYYTKPGSRTPRRYNCQPDLVEQAAEQTVRKSDTTHSPDLLTAIAAAQQRERERVRPQFNSTRYSTPAYCQLSHACAEEIKRGADDESEMGAFHQLYQPQRAANLRARLDEYLPAGMEAGIIYVS
ncbi:hypothetical protein IQ268_15880 [Oculatella sp. LEGE 06141]|uniref:hypothetical protein n=1 Tax=Oculatella sp. LEGE 06141 TaxID=1828648 RepID=UPI00188207EC|nr:hypothetical protein [Oculatella sp. LEGE 06141]MBE9180050.1 hypothetical protein [Oculatella sp. LEGE 06141]